MAKINGSQVGLLIGKAEERGLRGRDFLEWLEFEAEVNVDVVEEIQTADMGAILDRLNEEPVAKDRR